MHVGSLLLLTTFPLYRIRFLSCRQHRKLRVLYETDANSQQCNYSQAEGNEGTEVYCILKHTLVVVKGLKRDVIKSAGHHHLHT